MNIIYSFVGLYIIALLGMFTHFLKKNIKGETLTEVKNYFSDNLKSTIIAFIFTSVMYFTYYNFLVVGQDFKDVMTIFMIGYMFDSTFNKYEAKTDIKLRGE